MGRYKEGCNTLALDGLSLVCTFVANKKPGRGFVDKKRRFFLYFENDTKNYVLEYRDLNEDCKGRLRVQQDDIKEILKACEKKSSVQNDLVIPSESGGAPLVIRASGFEFEDDMVAHERAALLHVLHVPEETTDLGVHVVSLITHALRTLPSVMFVTKNTVAYHFCHGGIGEDDVSSYRTNEVHFLETNNTTEGWKWNDFTCNTNDQEGRDRGKFKMHGHTNTLEYLRKNGFISIIRGHQDTDMLTVMYKEPNRCGSYDFPGVFVFDHPQDTQKTIDMENVAVLTTSAAAPMKLFDNKIVYCCLRNDTEMKAKLLRLTENMPTHLMLQSVRDELNSVKEKGCNLTTLNALEKLAHRDHDNLLSAPYSNGITKFFDDITMKQCVQAFLNNISDEIKDATKTKDQTIVRNKTLETDDVVLIVGDLHSGLHALVRILRDWIDEGYMNEHGVLKDKYHVVFLGDMINRGYFSTEILFLVFSLSNANPEKVFVLNGNHEDESSLWKFHGFESELKKEYGQQVMNRSKEVMRKLEQAMRKSLLTTSDPLLR